MVPDCAVDMDTPFSGADTVQLESTFFQKVFDEALKEYGLLENKDCSENLADCILLTFKELTDMYVGMMGPDQYPAAEKFVDLLVVYGAIPVFVSTLGGFPSTSTYCSYDDIHFRSLQPIAHMMFIKPDVADIVCKETKLVDWVLDNLKIDDTRDYRKEYAVGFLTTLLESTTSFDFGELGVVQLVVDALLPYTPLAPLAEDKGKGLPVEEQFLLDSLFKCLSCLLLVLNNREPFAKAGGVDRMIQIIKQKRLNYMYYGSAVVTLDLALKNCPAAYDKFVDASGLDIAFPAIIPSCVTHDKEEIEELLISIIASLTGGITNEANKDALLSKFEENDSRSTTWLMKLFKRYFNKMQAWELKVEARKNLEMDQSELYDSKLRYGLSTLQLIAVILGYLWLSKNSKISARIEEELSHHNLKKKDARDILVAYRDSIDDAGKSAKTAVIEEYMDFLETQEELPAAHSEDQKINPDEPVVDDDDDDEEEDDDDKGEDQQDGDVSGRSKQSRSEKKSHKAMLKKLVMKRITGTYTFREFRDAKIEDLSSQLQTQAAEQFKASGSSASGQDEEDVDETGVEPKDIELVMAQAGVSRPKAVKAIKACDGDLIYAILDLTS